VVNSLALVKHALDRCEAASPVLSSQGDEDESAPRNIQVTKKDIGFLHGTLSGELQRYRALAELFNSAKATASQTTGSVKPLSAQLSDFPSGGVDLENIVSYPPRLEPLPVKPLFLDVAWNYIDYPDKRDQSSARDAGKVQEKNAEPEAKPQKRGWFGFGR
jgi:signal recognition particle subunit SRP68